MNPDTEKQHTQLDLDLNDLIDLRIFLQLVSKRGSIVPQEMERFGAIYNKIDKSLTKLAPDAPTLDTIVQQQQQQQGQQQEQEQQGNNEEKAPKNIITL